MSHFVAPNGDVFRKECELVDVTSNSRPDTNWRHVDAAGHVHRWYVLDPDRSCEACTAGYRLSDTGIHYNDAGGGWTWGVCRKRTPYPAESYDPTLVFSVPSLVWVKDGEYYDTDLEEIRAYGHTECRQCSEHIEPRNKADEYRVYRPGLISVYINDIPVGREEFEQRLNEVRKTLG